jgi:NAD+--dinitrogen-reductase ADP-D-ribosyltransferase
MSLNRCNLPTVILGSLTFQQHPVPIEIDGIRHLHRDLFDRLSLIDDAGERAGQFVDYMCVYFRLEHREEVGWTSTIKKDRSRADYRRLVRGWLFNPDGLEAAVLKGWVESRFGLVPRYHAGIIRSPADAAYLAYREAWSAGLYNTNALEAQLDVLYAFCQYELHRRFPYLGHLRLYRGVTRFDEHEVLAKDGRKCTVILNNLSSFTDRRERADEFGDQLLTTDVPISKITFYQGLLPGLLQGEGEHAVLGGVYEVALSTW